MPRHMQCHRRCAPRSGLGGTAPPSRPRPSQEGLGHHGSRPPRDGAARAQSAADCAISPPQRRAPTPPAPSPRLLDEPLPRRPLLPAPAPSLLRPPPRSSPRSRSPPPRSPLRARCPSSPLQHSVLRSRSPLSPRSPLRHGVPRSPHGTAAERSAERLYLPSPALAQLGLGPSSQGPMPAEAARPATLGVEYRGVGTQYHVLYMYPGLAPIHGQIHCISNTLPPRNCPRSSHRSPRRCTTSPRARRVPRRAISAGPVYTMSPPGRPCCRPSRYPCPTSRSSPCSSPSAACP